MQLPIKRITHCHHRIQSCFLLLFLQLRLAFELSSPFLQTYQVQALYQMGVLFISAKQLYLILCEVGKVFGKKALVVLVITEFLDFLGYSMNIPLYRIPLSRYFD